MESRTNAVIDTGLITESDNPLAICKTTIWYAFEDNKFSSITSLKQ